MVVSMTGFASQDFHDETGSWTIEIRGVNAKGLDIRARLPEPLLTAEPQIRKILAKLVSRGSINLAVKLDANSPETQLMVNTQSLNSYLTAASQVEAQAAELGLTLTPSRAVDFLTLRGVLGAGGDQQEPADISGLLARIEEVAMSFAHMRQAEGAALKSILLEQLSRIEALVQAAEACLGDRQAHVAQAMRRNIDHILTHTESVSEERLAHELAMMAVKSDVTEEIDRLTTHVASARALLDKDGPIGRKLDFLTQEFNREANTLCSKSQNSALTQVGLDLKAVVDQMREQVQNVE